MKAFWAQYRTIGGEAEEEKIMYINSGGNHGKLLPLPALSIEGVDPGNTPQTRILPKNDAHYFIKYIFMPIKGRRARESKNSKDFALVAPLQMDETLPLQ